MAIQIDEVHLQRKVQIKAPRRFNVAGTTAVQKVLLEWPRLKQSTRIVVTKYPGLRQFR